jgi:hypothetical protein
MRPELGERLPHLTLAQVYDALSYYEDHRAEVDRRLQVNTPEVWRESLRQHLGEYAPLHLTQPPPLKVAT